MVWSNGGRFLLSCVLQSVKTKETSPTRQALKPFAGESTLLKYTIGMEMKEGSVLLVMKSFV